MHLEAVVDRHAAAFLGCAPWEVAREPALLADAHKTAWSCYHHRTILAGVDPPTLEAAAWGAELTPGDDPASPFQITRPLLADLRDVPRLVYLDPNTNPQLLTVADAARRLLAEVPATVAVPVSGPLALACAVAGRPAVLAAMARDADETRDLLVTLVKRLRPWIHAIGRCGAQVAIVEGPYDPGALLPEQFAACVRPALDTLAQMTRMETSFAPSLHIEGDTAPIARWLAQTGASLLNCAARTNRAAFVEQILAYPELVVRVDVAPGMWADGDWPGVCRSIAEAVMWARKHERLVLGTGPLPLNASSVLIVDACSFASRLDPWLDPW